MGLELLLQRRYAEALPHIDEALRLNPLTSPGGIQVNRGRALLGLGRVEEAIAAYQQALTVNPNYHLARLNLGVIYFQQEKWSQAIEHLRVALATAPHDSMARFSLALALEKVGQDTEAVQHLNRLLLLRPDHHPARVKLGMLLASAGRLEEAMGQFRFVLARQDDPAAHAELAAALLKLGDTTSAVQHYQRALQRESPFWAAIAGRLAWLQATHPSPAVRDGRAALALAEQACRMTGYQAPELIQSLAAAQAEFGDFEAAVASAQQAAKLAAQTGQSERAAEIEQHLEFFRRRQPYRCPQEVE